MHTHKTNYKHTHACTALISINIVDIVNDRRPGLTALASASEGPLGVEGVGAVGMGASTGVSSTADAAGATRG